MKNCSVSKVFIFHHERKLYIWPFLIQITTFGKWLRLSGKSLLSKTEKTQISEQTQIIWVRWSLYSSPSGPRTPAEPWESSKRTRRVVSNTTDLWRNVSALNAHTLQPHIQRLHRTQIIWVCSDIWVFSGLDNRLLADNLSHLPKVLIWLRKGCIPLFWNTNALETVNSPFHGMK